MSHLICKLFTLISAGNVEEAQSLLKAPTASLDACVAASSDEDDGSDEEEMQDEAGGVTREPEAIQLTAEQQADVEDGWGVIVKTSRGKRKEVVGGMDQS